MTSIQGDLRQTSRWPLSFSHKFLLALLSLYLVSLGLLRIAWIEPAIPWAFIPVLLLVSLPIAASLALIQGEADKRHLRFGECPWQMRLGLGLLGVLVVYLSSTTLLWLVVTVGLLPLAASAWTWRKFASMAFNCVLVVLGYACVWNANYLLGWLVADRLIDARLLTVDLWLFRNLGIASSYDGAFPLVQHPWLFRLLENGYMMLFPEVMLVLLLAAARWTQEAVSRWVAWLFAAYSAGLLVFLVIPAVGPPIFQPASLSGEFHGTITHQIMQGMHSEFENVRSGKTLNGFGYFVAVPSLHVAVAILLQWVLRSWPLQFWLWLPVNLLLIVSTVALGYHYVVDLLSGLMLGAVVIKLWSAQGERRWPVVSAGV